MSGKTPWWYSGEGDDGEIVAETPSSPEAYSPQTPDDASPGASAENEESAGGARDWTALVMGAQRIVDWATERVMAPHAEHQDPAEHPDCVVCRTMAVLGDVGLRSPAPVYEDAEAEQDVNDVSSPGEGAARRPDVIQWIPIRGEVVEP
jgi:hypothetical protein